jgi:hypothetical protein
MAPNRRPENRASLRLLAAALALVGLMGAARAADAASFSNLTIVKNGANSAFQLTQTATSMRTRDSAVSIVSSGANAFTTRYAMVVGADVGNAGTVTENMTANYTITFRVTAPVGEAWVVNLVTSRVGAMTLVDDGTGSARDTLSAVTGTKTGAGALTGSLALALVPTITSGNTTNTPFNQTSTAAISGVGTGVAQQVTLTFNWTASARSTRTGTNGDEAAVRMGLTSAATGFTADDYPGIGGRTMASDGHFVSATLVPEPTPVALLLTGLTGLAFAGTRRQR